MLVQILDYIKKHGMVSTQQIARTFHVDEAALEPMLNMWVSKGVIQACEQSGACQTSCFKCKKSQPTYYEPVLG